MAYPTDFSDVSDGDIITASRNNAITKKIGLTSLATLGATTGHFSLPTAAGVPSGDPVNGAGSMVWDNSNNALYINEDGSAGSWATIGGGSSAFTEQVTIATGTDPALEVDQTSTGNIVDFQKSGTTKVYITDDGAIVVPEDTAGGKIQFGTDVLNRIRGSDGNNCMYVGPSNVAFYSGSEIRDIGTLNGVSAIKQQAGGYGSGLALTSMAQGGSSIDQPMTFASGAQVATGDQIAFNFSAEITKATSGNYTGLKLNVTETDVNAGNFLIDLQVGGSTVFNLDPDGVFAINSGDPALTIEQSGAGEGLWVTNATAASYTQITNNAITLAVADGSTPKPATIGMTLSGGNGYLTMGRTLFTDATKALVIGNLLGNGFQMQNKTTWFTDAGADGTITWTHNNSFPLGFIIGNTVGNRLGHIDLYAGASGSTTKIAYTAMASSNSTMYYLFFADDGDLKMHTAIPTADSDGTVVGTQS